MLAKRELLAQKPLLEAAGRNRVEEVGMGEICAEMHKVLVLRSVFY